MSDWDSPVRYGDVWAVRHAPSGQMYCCPTYDDVQRLLTGSPPQKRSRVLAWWRGYRRSFLTLACWALLIFSVDLEARVVAPIFTRSPAAVSSAPLTVGIKPASLDGGGIKSQAGDLISSVWQNNLDKKLTWHDDPRWLPHARYASAAAPKRHTRVARRGR